MNRLLKTTGIMACLFLAFVSLQAGNCEYAQKSVSKSFAVTENTTLKIENSYGAITISEWDKNEIAFTVIIKTTAKKQKIAQELVDKVSIDFKQEKEFVFAKTNHDPPKGKCNCTYRIEYQVSVPKNIHYDLKTEYGKITMGNATGDVNVSLMYGDFSGNEFLGNSKINISYGELSIKKLSGENDELTSTSSYCGKDLSISEVKNLKVNMKYSKLFIGSVKRLTIESQNTDVKITKAEKIELNSRYGKYEIGEVRELISNDCKTWYTKFEINRLTGTFSVAGLTYGNITIKNVMPSFENISINANRTPIKMTLDAAIVSCQLQVEVKGGELRVDAPKIDIPAFKSINPVLVSVTLGEKKSPKSVIKLTTENCNIKMDQL